MILSIEVQGPILTNCYLYADDETHHAFLIDPGFEPERILAVVREKGLTVEKILLTHGHFDHIGAACEVARALGVPICASGRSRKYLTDAAWNLSAQFFPPDGFTIPEDDVTYLEDGETVALECGSLSLRLVPTPGHTEDGTMYVSGNAFDAHADGMAPRVAFVGDTIFRASYGATHFPGGDERTLLTSIREKILTLPDDVYLLSGHSAPTTVREEKTRPWYFPLYKI